MGGEYWIRWCHSIFRARPFAPPTLAPPAPKVEPPDGPLRRSRVWQAAGQRARESANGAGEVSCDSDGMMGPGRRSTFFPAGESRHSCPAHAGVRTTCPRLVETSGMRSGKTRRAQVLPDSDEM